VRSGSIKRIGGRKGSIAVLLLHQYIASLDASSPIAR
jgi:hypothetical protein